MELKYEHYAILLVFKFKVQIMSHRYSGKNDRQPGNLLWLLWTVTWWHIRQSSINQHKTWCQIALVWWPPLITALICNSEMDSYWQISLLNKLRWRPPSWVLFSLIYSVWRKSSMKCSYASMNQQFALAVPEYIYGDIQNTMGLYNILTNNVIKWNFKQWVVLKVSLPLPLVHYFFLFKSPIEVDHSSYKSANIPGFFF